MNYSPADVKRAIGGLRSKLGLTADESLQEEFDAGLHPNMLSYGKIQTPAPSLPVLEKYLIGATSFLHQPSNHYDIFRACRCVNLVQFLDTALETLLAKHVNGLSTRLGRIIREVEHDAFDAAAFEIITAARYASHPLVDHLEFIGESPNRKTPDFRIRASGLESSVECKKVDRSQNYTILIRNIVRDHLNAVISSFQFHGTSVLADVVFKCDPQEINESHLTEACKSALSNGTTIIEPDFTIKAVRLPRYECDKLTLFPSPIFLWQRYGYRIRSDWFGIVNQLYGSTAKRADLPAHLQGGVSTWVDQIDWDAAIKWTIDSEDVLAKYRRFAFDALFKGLDQIKDAGANSSVHLWLESEYYIRGRRSSLADLLQRLSKNARSVFGWIIINETLFDVSPKGHFDLIEHAHFIRGPSATTREALVYGVFTPPYPSTRIAEFGIGTELPDIDE